MIKERAEKVSRLVVKIGFPGWTMSLRKFADPVERITGLLSERVKEEMPMTAAIRDDWPPCFESAVSELNQGVNVNHVGRVFLPLSPDR